MSGTVWCAEDMRRLAIKKWREIVPRREAPREGLFVFRLVLVLILMILQAVSLLKKIILDQDVKMQGVGTQSTCERSGLYRREIELINRIPSNNYLNI